MIAPLDISELCRRTGLTSRTLRFYEARGLLKPLRSQSGRRLYGAGEMERLHQIIMLKRAGMRLADIERVMARRGADLAGLVETQIGAVTEQLARLGEVRALLLTVKSRLDRNESLDAAALCTLIHDSTQAMATAGEAWDALVRRYMDEATQAEFAQAMPAMAHVIHQPDYAAKWQALGQRIKAALPLAPDTPEALGFVRAWMALLAPFSAVATPAMWAGAHSLYDDVDSWAAQSGIDPGFDGAVWRFIYAATAEALARGIDIGPVPPWMHDEMQEGRTA